MYNFFLNPGERGLIVGQTGSGKTKHSLFQLRNAPSFPVIIFDTKIDDVFFSLPDTDETIDRVESFDALKKYSKMSREDMADYILVRPGIEEVLDYEILDSYTRLVYNSFGEVTIFFDELYNWHNRGIPSNGFVALLTRGRSKGKTVLQATQRPGWISRFCFTESQKFYIHRLIDRRDRKTLESMIPDFADYPQPGKFGFYFFEAGESDVPVEYAPVPPLTYKPVEPDVVNKPSSRKWV